MGGAENLRTILNADVLSVERVSAATVPTDLKWKDGDLKLTETTVNQWHWGMPLNHEKGFVPIPALLSSKIRNVFHSADQIPDSALSCGYLPWYRIELREPQHTLEIYIIHTVYIFDVYRDGIRIGSHSGDGRIIAELETFLNSEAKKEPNSEGRVTR
jgi:hypothetical protein